ncbi:MAG: hypothetical protein Q9218_003219 [Villophora microphyllina]
MTELEVALAANRDTKVVKYVKNICEVHKLGAKKKGPDLASQYVTHFLFGHTPAHRDWIVERKRVMEKRHAGDVLKEFSQAFGPTIFLLLPPSSLSFCLKAHSQTEYMGEVTRQLAAAKDMRLVLSALNTNVVQPLMRGIAPQIALIEVDTTNLEATAVDVLFTPARSLTLRLLNRSFLLASDAAGSEKADGDEQMDGADVFDQIKN